MSRAVRFLSAVALLAAALPAAAYVRESTTGDPFSGTCLWWGGRSVTYEINPEGVTSSTCSSVADAELAVSTAVGLWADATYAGSVAPCTDFHFSGGAESTRKSIGHDGHNLIVFRKGLCAAGQTPSVNNCWNHGDIGIVALTTTTQDDTTGQILDADVELYSTDGTHGMDFGCTAAGGTATSVDITAVMGHEAGHPCTPEYGVPVNCIKDTGTSLPPIMSPQVGGASQKLLAQDDVTAVCTIYPKGGATLTCPPVEPPGGASHGGCSSAGGVGILGVLALLAAMRRRGRSA